MHPHDTDTTTNTDNGTDTPKKVSLIENHEGTKDMLGLAGVCFIFLLWLHNIPFIILLVLLSVGIPFIVSVLRLRKYGCTNLNELAEDIASGKFNKEEIHSRMLKFSDPSMNMTFKAFVNKVWDDSLIYVKVAFVAVTFYALSL